MRACWAVLLLVGCYRPNGIESCVTTCGGPDRLCPAGLICDNGGLCKTTDMAGDCPTPDADIDAFVYEDAGPDAPLTAKSVCFGAMGSFFRTCVDPGPSNTINPAQNWNIDTTACAEGYIQPQSNPPGVCVIVAAGIVINNGITVRATGQRPLALFATGSLTISGTIDVASHGADKGAGGNTGGDCVPVDGVAGSGGGGAAGGAFGFAGGRGGKGTGGLAGAPSPLIGPIDRVRGGCNGGAGGKGIGGIGGGGGRGGGALYLMTPGTLTITASAIINASGGLAGSGGRTAGGGGGGAGGFIGLHANAYTIDPNARVFAIGGGGASGGISTAMGNNGVETTTPMNTGIVPGVGGSDGTMSGFGGAGTFEIGGDGGNASGTSSDAGGGGGGGGGGVIGIEGQMPPNTQNWRPNPVPL